MSRSTFKPFISGIRGLLLCPVFLLFFAQPGTTQDPGQPYDPSPTAVVALSEFQDRSSGLWRPVFDSKTGYIDHIYGGIYQSGFMPVSDSDWFDLALHVADELTGVTGIDPGTLVDPSITRIKKSRIKDAGVWVQFHQEYDGYPVKGVGTTFFFTPSGDLTVVFSSSIPSLYFPPEGTQSEPAESKSIDAACQLLELGKGDARISNLEDCWIRHSQGKVLEPKLTKAIWFESSTGGKGNCIIYMAEEGLGPMAVRKDKLKMHCSHSRVPSAGHRWGEPGLQAQISGNVQVNCTDGILPIELSSVQPKATPYISVKRPGSLGEVSADEFGYFAFDANQDETLTFFLSTVERPLNEPFFWVYAIPGSQYSWNENFVCDVPKTTVGIPTTISELAQANAFTTVLEAFAWGEDMFEGGVIPFSNEYNVAVDYPKVVGGLVDPGEAAFITTGNGGIFLFAKEDPDFRNMAYRSPIAHEVGHAFLSTLGSTFPTKDGSMAEGACDAFAMYFCSDPEIGPEYRIDPNGGTLPPIRTGNNTREFCGDGNEDCHGDIYDDGEVLMGVFWKAWSEYSNSTGNPVEDCLAVLATWVRTTPEDFISTAVMLEVLIAADSDNNPYNGMSPLATSFHNAFVTHGFPALEPFKIVLNEELPPDTKNAEDSAFVLIAPVSLAGNDILDATISFTKNGQAFSPEPMKYDSGNNLWYHEFAVDPLDPPPTTYRYSIEVTDFHSNSKTFPEAGNSKFSFKVGQKDHLLKEYFDGPTSAGWTNGSYLGLNDWQRGVPGGNNGVTWGVAWTDPENAPSSPNIWGTDIGGTFGAGDYESASHYWLRSPIINSSGKFGISLELERWLTVELYDQAVIRGIESSVQSDLWSSPSTISLRDFAWQHMDLDLGLYDDTQAFQIEFATNSDFGREYGGWNIDNVSVFSLGAPDDLDWLILQGPSEAQIGSQVSYVVRSCPRNTDISLYWSASNTGTTQGGHYFDLGAPVNLITTVTSDAYGRAFFHNIQVPSNAPIGTIFLEAVSVSGGVRESQDLDVTITQ